MKSTIAKIIRNERPEDPPHVRGGGHEHVMPPTFIRPKSETSRPWSSLGARFELPADLLRDARARVSRVALVSLPLASVLAVAWLGAGLLGLVDWETAWRIPGAVGVLLVAIAALYYACKSPRFSDTTIIYLSFAYEIVLSGLAGFTHASHEFHRFGIVTPFGPHVLVISAFPLLVPAPPGLVLVASALAATASTGGLAVAAALGLASANAGTYADFASLAVGSTVLAFIAARLVHRLHAEVARAKRLGSYELQELLGSGGMGEVWAARHHLLARPAAIKLIRREAFGGAGAGSEVFERFSREARATAALESPHTIRLFDFGVTDDGTLYYAMELLDGIDLDTLVATLGPLPPARAVPILLQLCDSIAEAHEVGLLHRDIKPANVMLCRLGRSFDFVKVLDFGLVAEHAPSPAESGSGRLTMMGQVVGTPGYMAPEALMGMPLDPRSDIYAIGCVAYWLLSGSRVFDRKDLASTGIAHIRDEVEPLASRGAHVPRELEAIILKCLEKRPDARPSSVDDVSEALRACVLDEVWDNQRAAAWWSGLALPRRRNITLSVPGEVRQAEAAT